MNLTVGAWQLRTQHTFSRTPGLREQRALNKRRGWPGLDARPSQRPLLRRPGSAKMASSEESPPIRSQMTRVVPRQGHVFMLTPGRKNFLCTPDPNPCNLAHDEKGLAQIAAFGRLRDLPHTLLALVAGAEGTCSLRTSTPNYSLQCTL
jgi:hypothetical protein